MRNADRATVEGFGHEWSRFDQASLPEAEARRLFDEYFDLFPWGELPPHAEGFDLGCGSGRWAKLVAPRVGKLHCIDASAEALVVARRNLGDHSNCVFHHASVDQIPLAEGSMDFGYSLGVLHHIPDTAAGLRACTIKLKHNAPFLVYLYYAFDNRPAWYRAVWSVSDAGRRMVSRLPTPLRHVVAEAIAAGVYFPLARTAAALEARGVDVSLMPLTAYRHRAFYSMRTDALDRFGTRIEKRFTARQVRELMEGAGLTAVRVSDRVPF
jgi:SAM-dependent methyltransferase